MTHKQFGFKKDFKHNQDFVFGPQQIISPGYSLLTYMKPTYQIFASSYAQKLIKIFQWQVVCGGGG